jgi:hypothetical protein
MVEFDCLEVAKIDGWVISHDAHLERPRSSPKAVTGIYVLLPRPVSHRIEYPMELQIKLQQQADTHDRT